MSATSTYDPFDTEDHAAAAGDVPAAEIRDPQKPQSLRMIFPGLIRDMPLTSSIERHSGCRPYNRCIEKSLASVAVTGTSVIATKPVYRYMIHQLGGHRWTPAFRGRS